MNSLATPTWYIRPHAGMYITSRSIVTPSTPPKTPWNGPCATLPHAVPRRPVHWAGAVENSRLRGPSERPASVRAVVRQLKGSEPTGRLELPTGGLRNPRRRDPHNPARLRNRVPVAGRVAPCREEP